LSGYKSDNWKAIVVAVTVSSVFLGVTACGTNLFDGVAPGKDETKVRVEEARVKMDEKDYAGALTILEDLQEDSDTDSNKVRLLLAAAILGDTGLDVWSIISKILDASSSSSSASSSSSKSGADSVLDAFSDSLLGVGEEKTAKLAGLNRAIELLRTAPTPSDHKVENTSCFLAAMMVVPTITEATSALTAASDAITAVSSQVTAGGACEVTQTINDSISQVTSLATSLSNALAAAENCAFLQVGGAASTLNTIETKMAKLLTNADKGCSLTNCPGCDALFPTCVRESLGVGGASDGAGDGSISGCEMTLHCSPLTICF